MSEQEKEASISKSVVNETGESHIAHTKYEKQKFGTNLSTLSAGGVATAKTTGFMKRVIGDSTGELGYWHKMDVRKQNILVIYAERLAFSVKEEHRRAVKAFKKHKDVSFKQKEEDDARKDFKNYKRARDFHAMIFTLKCLMTVSDVRVALVGKSERIKLLIIKEQINIWVVELGGTMRGFHSNVAIRRLIPDICWTSWSSYYKSMLRWMSQGQCGLQYRGRLSCHVPVQCQL